LAPRWDAKIKITNLTNLTQKRAGSAEKLTNKRLAEQTRKILGKHYASKYRVR
jgi:hypothetical protein